MTEKQIMRYFEEALEKAIQGLEENDPKIVENPCDKARANIQSLMLVSEAEAIIGVALFFTGILDLHSRARDLRYKLYALREMKEKIFRFSHKYVCLNRENTIDKV